MRLARLGTTTAALAALLAPAAHAERVPSLRAAGCRPDSAQRVRRAFPPGRPRRTGLRLALTGDGR